MAPTKSTRNALTNTKQQATAMISTSTRKTVTRRGGIAENIQQDQNMEIQTRGKRKAENSPVKNDKVKRSALSSLTNNVKIIFNNNNTGEDDSIKKQHNALKKKDINIYSTQQPTQTQVLNDIENLKIATNVINNIKSNNNKNNNNIILKTNSSNNNNNNNNNIFINNNGTLQKQTQTKIMTRAAAARNNAVLLEENNKIKTRKSDVQSNILGTAPVNKGKKAEELPPPAAPIATHANCPNIKLPNKPTRRISNDFNKTEDSLYMSALEDISSIENSRLSGNFERHSVVNLDKIKTEENVIEAKTPVNTPPEGVEDFDKQNWNDPYQVSHYAMDIFKYLKSREKEFIIDDYMPRQLNLSKWMRSLLVDWMVEVQETFELNHETLYLAVKIVDIYLSRVVIHKDKLQLLGAASLFIACKFDERTPPLVEDFLYICDGAYKHKEIILMEMTVLRTIDFDLGIPLSYRFLRRYARCDRVKQPTLTLARYILELSLMDYATIGLSDSRMACAALFMALRMHGKAEPWNLTLEYYTEYKLEDFAFIVPILNTTLHHKPKGSIKTILSKYSHKIFHEAAKVPHMSTEMLFKDNFTPKQIEKILLEYKVET